MRLVHGIISIVRIAQTLLRGSATFALILIRRIMLLTSAGHEALVPHDKVNSGPLSDIVGTVSLLAEVGDAPPNLVSVPHLKLSVVSLAHDPAEGEASGSESRLAEAHVEGDVGIIRMHVET